jgi:hypothetical protein
MAYNAVITKITNVRKHSNADRVLLGTCWGNQVVVSLDTKEGDLGIYFPCDGQLSLEFAQANDLLRRKNEDGSIAGGMFDENRRVRVQKFRGEISDGFWIPISCLSFATVSPEHNLKLVEGYEFDTYNTIHICNKYVSNSTHGARGAKNQPKAKKTTSVMFKEHYDTGQWGKNTHRLEPNDLIIITEKLHGTSQRIGYVQVDIEDELKWWEKLLIRLLKAKHFTQYRYLNGTRRVVLDPKKSGTGFHGDDLREQAASPFLGKLHKGETVYFEVVGFEPNGKEIMSPVDIRKMKDKEFEKLWRQGTPKPSDIPGVEEAFQSIACTMHWSYGCRTNEHKVFVYRITTTNEDGVSVDYSWADVKRRCLELDVEHVPELYIKHYESDRGVSLDEIVLAADFLVDRFSKGASTLDSKHIKEGVCVRLESGLEPRVFKHKSFEFKVLEGIIKDSDVVDMEEVS